MKQKYRHNQQSLKSLWVEMLLDCLTSTWISDLLSETQLYKRNVPNEPQLKAQLSCVKGESRTYPKYRRSHIQGMCCDGSFRGVTAECLQFDSDLSDWLRHTRASLSWLAASQHYLVVASVFFEVQLERKRSQSNSCILGWGFEVSQWERRPQTETPKPLPSITRLAASSQTHTQDTISYVFMNIVIFYLFLNEGAMNLFIAELSSNFKSPRGKLFTHFHVCGLWPHFFSFRCHFGV